MRIRTITCFFEPSLNIYQTSLGELALFSQQAAEKLMAAGFEVQTRRVATTPFAAYTSTLSRGEALVWFKRFEADANREGFTYTAFGPALTEYPDSYELIPDCLAQSKNAFFGAVIADRFQVYPAAIRAAAQVIARNANIEINGFANLQFTALANVPAGVPFFPAAYHQTGKGKSFALAIECADEVLQAFEGSTSLAAARSKLLARLEEAAVKIQACLVDLYSEAGITFGGFDFSPAPFPFDGCSLGGALEAVGQNQVGRDGSLAAAAVIADTLDQGKWPRAGFNGLMLPVLEDSVLARRAAEGTFSVKDLLLYSAVCGTGLDTVPIPGDSSEDEIAAVLFDVAALSVRLGKPLTARLMPIPGKKAGDKTNFDFDFFAPSRVLPLAAGKVQLPLNGSESIPLAPRHVHQRMRR
jgi:uncharacterized protein (UPF0210 family)